MLGTRSIRRLVDVGYANSPINKLAGLMTYQLFISFVRGGENVDKSIDSLEALEALGAANAITRHFIRAESIATAQGTSVRTVQRRVAEAMAHYRVGSRFELGVAWAADGA